jgi:hypothetical protein
VIVYVPGSAKMVLKSESSATSEPCCELKWYIAWTDVPTRMVVT